MTDDFWLNESITSYSEAINYLGLFHLYQDNRAATERQKPDYRTPPPAAPETTLTTIDLELSENIS